MRGGDQVDQAQSGRGRRDVGASTREAVLDAALAVFTEYTFAGSSIALVADRAGVAVGSIYRHFDSKEALGNAVFRRWKSRLLSYLEDSTDETKPVREAFAALWRAMYQFTTDHPAAFAFLEHQQHHAYLDAESHAVSARVEQLAGAMVARGQAAGEVREGDPALLVALSYGAFVGLTKSAANHTVSPAWFTQSESAVWDLLRA